MPSSTTLLNQAFTLDAAGREAQAIPLYRQAISRGLSKPNLRHALICLGSSLRTTNQLPAAIRTLRKARTLYPKDPTIPLFLALAHADNHQLPLALRQLANCLLNESKSPALKPYKKILTKKFHALRK